MEMEIRDISYTIVLQTPETLAGLGHINSINRIIISSVGKNL